MRILAYVFAAIALTGCAYHSESIVLLPHPDGKPSAIVVTTSSGVHEIAAPYSGLEVRDGQDERKSFTEAEIHQRFGMLLAVPVRPVAHTLFFLNNSTVLTPESKLLIPEIARGFGDFAAVEILVVGHADTAGPDKVNDPLALKRAAEVRKLLVQAGVGANNIVIAGRGEREPLRPTGDGVSEPRNRRVEITLR